MRLVNAIVVVLLPVPMGACTNRVVSETPWFHAAAREAGPRLRDGVWRDEDVRCRTNESAPVERWPGCAQWRYRRGNQSLTLQWVEEGAGRHRIRANVNWSVSEQLIVAGDPLIVQNTDCPREQAAASAEEAATGQPDSAPPPPPPLPATAPATAAPWPDMPYCYDAARATAYDAEGRITAVEVWPVLCGPWPRQGGKVTDQPWPGLSVVDVNCTAASEAALREAAKRSHAVALGQHYIGRMHWVRDGYR